MNNKKVVCVTGASGYIASWIVKLLLFRGYTVRDLNDPNKTEHLLSLDGAKERLHLFQANLLEDGSFDSAIDGCEGVFHTASPVIFYVKDPQAELLDPAVKGTLNVLSSCAQVPSIKRVVLSSSIAAVAFIVRSLGPEVVVDETWFSDPDYCKQIKNWYYLSKTLAEDKAWKFAKENSIDLVSINPSMVIAPLLQTLNRTVEDILDLIRVTTYPNSVGAFVDVRDVANAHIQALEIPSTNGRYCVVESVAHYSEVVKILRDSIHQWKILFSKALDHYSEVVKILHDLYPDLQLPTKCADDYLWFQQLEFRRKEHY